MSSMNSYVMISAQLFFVFALLVILAALIKSKGILAKLVCLEVLANTLIAAIALWAYKNQIPMALDICIPIALIMFLSNVAYCHFLTVKEKASV